MVIKEDVIRDQTVDFNEIITRFQHLSFATKEGIWEYDFVEKKSYYNKGMFDMWGYDELEMADNNKWWRNNIHPQDKKRIITQLDELIAGKETVWGGKYQFKHKDGTYKLILDRLFVVRDERGNALRLIGTMQDVTEMDKLQTEFEKIRTTERQAMLRSMIWAIEKERKLISEELHENINQALALINMHLAWLKITIQKEALPAVAEAQGLLLNSISGIRDISNRLSPLTLESLGLTVALEELLADLFKKKKIKGTVEIAENAVTDKDIITLTVIYRIAQHQADNILKHSNAKNVFIKLSNVNGKLKMSIYDDGMGVEIKTLKYGNGFSTIQNKAEAFGGSFNIKTLSGEKGFLLEVII